MSKRLQYTCIRHSAKGSTWKDHKYIKKVGDRYVYAESSESASETNNSSDRSTSESNNSSESSNNNSTETPAGFDLDEMVKKVIRGEFGNGADRKELLGDSYDEIQAKVNEFLRSGSKATTSNVSAISTDKVESGKSFLTNKINIVTPQLANKTTNDGRARKAGSINKELIKKRS